MILSPIGMLASSAEPFLFYDTFTANDGTDPTSRDVDSSTVGRWDSGSTYLRIYANTSITHNESPWLAYQWSWGTPVFLIKDFASYVSGTYTVSADLISHKSGTYRVFGQGVVCFIDASNHIFFDIDLVNGELRVVAVVDGSVTATDEVSLSSVPADASWTTFSVEATITSETVTVSLPSQSLEVSLSIPEDLQNAHKAGLRGITVNLEWAPSSWWPVADNFRAEG